MIDPHEYGQRFRRARDWAGLSQEALGALLRERTGKGSEATVIRVEKGARLPTVEEIAVVTELAGRDWEAFAGRARAEGEHPPATAEDVAGLRQSVDEQRDDLAELSGRVSELTELVARLIQGPEVAVGHHGPSDQASAGIEVTRRRLPAETPEDVRRLQAARPRGPNVPPPADPASPDQVRFESGQLDIGAHLPDDERRQRQVAVDEAAARLGKATDPSRWQRQEQEHPEHDQGT